MTGSIPFSINNESADKFQRSLKKLKKIHGDAFVEKVLDILAELINDQYPVNSRQEPLPGKIKLPEGYTFHKLEFTFSKGASGQIRLMYVINKVDYEIIPLWIYNHEQFEKRPPDVELVNILKQILDM
ncbi:MAG TPA: hypothetical protein VK203_11185 [Nostocaceae cyanobacterium]|nr:hypothetical protein [Nostocaceae cyanobacterium]